MSIQTEKPDVVSPGLDAIQAILSRHGRLFSKRPGGVGLPTAQTLVLRDFETRRISLEVLLDREWTDKLRNHLRDADDNISDAALNAVDRQASELAKLIFEALIYAIEVGDFNASVVIDTTGYERP